MAKFVIAGVANCPRFAQVELLADQLQLNLPEFNLHKITKLPGEWENWLNEECSRRGWSHSRSPITWRELVDRGGKGLLIGGANEFQEYVANYYGLQSSFTSDDSQKVAAENLKVVEEDEETIQSAKAKIKPLNVCITNAASPVGYALMSAIASGDVFGKRVPLSIRLHDLDENLEALSGVTMEAVDLATDSVHQTSVTSDLTQSVADCSIVILLDEVEREAGEEHSSWLRRVHQHFAERAEVIARSARPDVHVIVGSGGPAANFIGTTICRTVPKISPSKVIVASRLVENRARAAIGRQAGVNAASIVDIVVWGDAAGSKPNRFAIDVSAARCYDCENGAIYGPGHNVALGEVVHDDRWLRTELPRIIAAENRQQNTVAMATANALYSLMRDWWRGTNTNRIYSLAICSKGWLGIPDGLFFSVPVKFTAKRKYAVVREFIVSDEMQDKLQKIIKELESDVEIIYPNPNKVVRSPPLKVKFADVLDQTVTGDNEVQSVDSGNPSQSKSPDLEKQPKLEVHVELESVNPVLEKIPEDSEGSFDNQ